MIAALHCPDLLLSYLATALTITHLSFRKSINLYINRYLSPFKFLIYWFVPHFIAQYGIVTLNMLQHDGCEEFYPGQDEVNFNTSR